MCAGVSTLRALGRLLYNESIRQCLHCPERGCFLGTVFNASTYDYIYKTETLNISLWMWEELTGSVSLSLPPPPKIYR